MSEIRMDQRSDASEEHGTPQTCNVIVTHNNLPKKLSNFHFANVHTVLDTSY